MSRVALRGARAAFSALRRGAGDGQRLRGCAGAGVDAGVGTGAHRLLAAASPPPERPPGGKEHQQSRQRSASAARFSYFIFVKGIL